MNKIIVERIREEFSKSDDLRDEGLLTPEKITRYDDLQYGPDENWNKLDIYQTKGTCSPQPTIVSVHGGGWVYGDKGRYQFYCMDLAKRGYTVVNFSYRLAPEYLFPAALEDVNQVFVWILNHADRYSIDLRNLFVVGDSAGAQLASQYMTLLTNTEYQQQFDFSVPCGIQIKAAALNCGIYDVVSYAESDKGEIFNVYLGKNVSELRDRVDIMKYLTKDFPPVYIMTSWYDFLKEQPKPMLEALKALGVTTEYCIYGTEEQTYMGHVFHLNIRLEEAERCNNEECAFFQKYIS